jgi:ribosomal protein L44E
MNRKERRREEKLKKKMSTEEQNLSEKISFFSQLEDECLACAKPFDKQDREMVQSWNVVVREDKDPAVRLYCPDCWQKAQNVVKEYMKQQEQKDDG